jgi:hypothetical protein
MFFQQNTTTPPHPTENSRTSPSLKHCKNNNVANALQTFYVFRVHLKDEIVKLQLPRKWKRIPPPPKNCDNQPNHGRPKIHCLNGID